MRRQMQKQTERDMKKKRKYQTLDDIISILQDYKEEYGNLPIKVRLSGLNQRPEISGIRYNSHISDNLNVSESIEIVPRYDIQGDLNKFSGVNSVIKEMANVQTLFVQYAKGMMSIKNLLDNIAKNGGKVSTTRAEFDRLYAIAREIRDSVNSLQGFDKKMSAVINESIKDYDYAAVFSHHIDQDMTDVGFAALVTDGIGEKTSVHRLAVYVEIIKKINAEIANRKRRISALEKRIKADRGSQESLNAKVLIGKSEGIVATLLKRRDYVMERFSALRKSVDTTINHFGDEIKQLYAEHPDTRDMKRRG